METKKITRATFKAFIKKNIANLYTVCFSEFNGMTDGLDFYEDPEVHKETTYDFGNKYTLGLSNVWLCGDDRYSLIEYNGMHGIKYYNCCGSGAILTK